MNSLLKVAVMLTAYDAMSREVQSAVGKSKKELTDLQNHSKMLFAKGTGMLGTSVAGFALIGKTVKDFADLQEGALDLKSTMMKDGGILNEKQFNAVNDIAINLGNSLPGTTADFHKMFTTMINSGINAENILNGVGKGAAYLAVALKMPYDEAGKFAAKMKESTGVADSELMDFLDTIARTKQVGVDAIEMQYAFAKSTGALKLMGIQGLEASKSMAAVDAMLIKSGQSGETIGTGMTSIFKNMLDPKSMSALNAVAGQFGITMEFMDKKSGKFLGIENMMAQFDKMKNLTAAQKNSISSAFLGDGKDSDFMNILADKGSAGFNAMTKAMSDQATLTQKVNLQTSGLNSQMEAFDGTITNISASLASQFEPMLTNIAKLMNTMASGIANFVKENPKLAKLSVLITAIVSAGLALAGVIMIIKGIIAVTTILNATLAINPFIAIAMAIVIAAAVIYLYWDNIVKFVQSKWKWLMAFIVMAFPFTLVLLPFILFGKWVYKNWPSITSFIGKSFSVIKKYVAEALVLLSPVTWLNAGINIGKSLFDGIKQMASKPVEAMKNIVKGMRDLLPFSPAKTGPFKDLHKLKIVETIAGTIKAAPMVRALSNVVSQAGAITARPPQSNSFGGGFVIHFNPTIHMGSGSSKADLMSALRESGDELVALIERVMANKNRAKY
jgi:TP901 family phage tail tape measure protein